MKIEVGKTYEVMDNYLGFRKGHTVEIVDVDAHDEDLLCTVVNGNAIVRVYKGDFASMEVKEVLKPTKPAHYDTAIDTIAFAKANFSREQVEGFMRINAIKYLQRAGKKDSVLSNLIKARHYIDMLIEMEEEKDEN